MPVFRYALERWPADSYEILVFSRGELPTKERAVVDWIQEHGSAGQEGVANCRVGVIDLDGQLDPYAQAVWDKQSSAKPPWMVVRYPRYPPAEADVWAGRPSLDVAKRMLDSPVRHTLAENLLRGDVMVWLFLPCGDRAKDAAALKLLRAELKRVEGLLELPPEALAPMEYYGEEETSEDEAASDDEPPRVVLSVVNVARRDPAEDMLVRMLLQSEPDLRTFTEPMAFPVFGRGRLLYALVGKGINAETIDETCAFLTGPCMCEVKAQNPGLDLLMSVDWDARVVEPLVGDEEFARLAGRPTTGPAAGNRAQGGLPSLPASEGEGPNLLVRSVLTALGVVVVLVVALALVVRRRLAQAA